MTKKEKRTALLNQLCNAEQEIEYNEYYLIPKLIKEIKELKPTKTEIRDYDLESYNEWK